MNEVVHTSTLGTMTLSTIFTMAAPAFRYVIVQVDTEYWTIDLYNTRRRSHADDIEIGTYWTFPTEDAAIMAATLLYGEDP